MLWKKGLKSSSFFHMSRASRLSCTSTLFRIRTPIILFRSLPADCADGIGYVSSTVMFDGVYPDRIKCSAVDEPIVPPPPTTMTLVVSREDAMLLLLLLLLFCGI